MPTGEDELVRQNRLTPTSFIHPVTKEVLFKAIDGTLAREAEPHHSVCPSKGTIYDFASLTGKQSERLHYDDAYREQSRLFTTDDSAIRQARRRTAKESCWSW